MNKDKDSGKQFNEVTTLDRLKDIPEQKKTCMQMMLEDAIRDKIQKEKTAS